MNRTTHQIEPEEVMAYLDGELAPERTAYVAAHIEACAECAAVAEELRGVSARLATWTIAPAPASLNSTVEAAAGELHGAGADATTPARETKPPLAAAGQAHPWRKRIFGVPQWAWGLAGSFAVLILMVGPLMFRLNSSMEVAQTWEPRELSAQVGSRPPEAASKPQAQAVPNPSTAKQLEQVLSMPVGDHLFRAQTTDESRPLAVSRRPMMIRTASVTLETRQFDATRAAIERIVRAHGGHLGQLQTAAPANQARTLTATLRIPADRLDAALSEVKNLGRVVKESQGSDEVTQPYADLVARIANARSTEQRLVEILRTRTGKVTEVLEVEREIAEVREQIERMDAQRKSLENQVSLSTVSLELREEFEKQMEVAPPSTGTLLWNAMVDGYDSAVATAVGLALFLLRAGPSLLLWAALLFFPARLAWRRIRTATS